jgi:hypothetical protein
MPHESAAIAELHDATSLPDAPRRYAWNLSDASLTRSGWSTATGPVQQAHKYIRSTAGGR